MKGSNRADAKLCRRRFHEGSILAHACSVLDPVFVSPRFDNVVLIQSALLAAAFARPCRRDCHL